MKLVKLTCPNYHRMYSTSEAALTTTIVTYCLCGLGWDPHKWPEEWLEGTPGFGRRLQADLSAE
jgi:hypothetical protein